MINLRKISKISLLLATLSSITTNVFADDVSAPDTMHNYFYIGGEFGGALPLKNSFDVKDAAATTMTIGVKNSMMYSAKIGYSFYPKMALELSATYHPKYPASYQLPEMLTIKPDLGKTAISSNVYILNMIYDLPEIGGGFEPFVLFGVGMAQITVKDASTSINIKGASDPMKVFEVEKTKTNCFAWQVGAGISKEIFPNFSIDLAAKMHITHNAKINFKTLTDKGMVKQDPIKKTLGIAEIGIGFTYKLPF